MRRNMRNKKMPKLHNDKRGKGGFTIVELCIVMALVALCSAMIVSFAAQMGDFSNSNRDEYAFIEDNTKLKDELSKWIAENDIQDHTFIADGSNLTVKEGESVVATFSLNQSFEAIDSIIFSTSDDGKLIKCTSTSLNGTEISFVFALRCATTKGGAA